MNERKWTIIGGLCVLPIVLMMASGCGKEKADKPAVPAAETGREDRGDDAGHGHAEGAATALAASIEERVSAKCEHSVPIYQCDECRYEAGVVKLDASLLKREDGAGLVRTQAVARTKMSEALPTTGEVALNENAAVHISPRIAGIIESVSADIGARVKAGDTLLTLASVELGKTLVEYERNRTLSELSEKIFTRETKLRDQKVGSGQDVIAAQMTFEQHRADLKASEQTLHVLGLTEADLAGMREPAHGVEAGRLPVRAPITGTIIEKHAVAGEMAEPGKDLMLLSDLTKVWVWANVHSRDLVPLLAAEKRGPVAVEITVAAFPGRKFNGVLNYVGATMNEQTRTVKVRATVENPDLELRPGMFCEAAISLGNGQAEEVLAAPRAAMFSDEGKSFVFKHWKDDFFVRQDVKKGREFFGMVEILEGLQAGEVIVTDGSFLLKSDILREKMGAGCAD
ncbi:MAG: efflux RND transporter periplasmic adaptor subunit [Verrucomicrobia bacterium]|nr:efflux RND transporter periplasmic adaptor subunit [Verrucomicrobiota bacterium]MCG2681362.1 efflux RND transporter periplasmic adaptor subunit [Kiritimatiellia bacterium]MBU4247638.1 efflux RND transporter periplasmic adaptor subunit [Verrucomicrobiota bacterium]MBU4290819.1 efflux RND transporter periplasmic adaptor subunit [Verrucomicrobiota bacterium]MBU4430326.1 efflux RND transporter periplasmic adaptor subunit [Verrucomicrobiota bacterium]